MNYLFDVINDISGYTEKYYEEGIELMDHEGLIQKYRKEKDEPNGKLLGDHHPHCLLVLESV